MKYEVYVNLLICNKFPRYTRTSQKRKFNSACNTPPFENQKENTHLNVSGFRRNEFHQPRLGDKQL